MKVFAVLIFASSLFSADRELTVSPTGPFHSVQAAIDAAWPHTVIHILPGTYAERITVPASKPFLTLRGDDAMKTILTGNSHAGLPGPKGPINTFSTQTVFVQANDFSALNLTFENSAGNQGQAVALTILGDRGIFRNCRFLGYQDTLLPQAGRQYFDRCYIAGATDFIFGGAAAFFDHCTIHLTANGYITAANTTAQQRYGYVFDHCNITSVPGVKTYLGRPWRPWSATVFLSTEMSEAIRPEGWNNWSDPAREKSVRYAEYASTGPGAAPSSRVPWARALTAAEASEFSIGKVLAGIDGWNPLTGKVLHPVSVAPAKVLHKAAQPVIPKSSAWLAATADGQIFTGTGAAWNPTRAHLPPNATGAHLLRTADGVFHAVWSSGKHLAHATSKDLLAWSEPTLTDIMASQNALDLQAPNLFFDGTQVIVTWSCTIAKNFIQAFQEDVEANPRIWYATTRDFATYSAPKLLFDNNYAVRDAQILHLTGRYALLHNDNTWPTASLRIAFGETPLGPWGPSTDAFTPKGTAAPAALAAGGEWWIFHSGGGVHTRDFWTFQEMPPSAVLPSAIIEVPRAFAAALPR